MVEYYWLRKHVLASCASFKDLSPKAQDQGYQVTKVTKLVTELG